MMEDKTAIVTGSSRGIGRATALLLAEKGAKVVVNYVKHAGAAKEVVDAIGRDRAISIKADVSREKDVERLLSESVRAFDRVDILVNNAGVIFRGADQESRVDLWRKTIDLNLTSAWLMARAVAPLMLRNGSGSIVNVSSIYGLLGAPSALPYSSAKGGLMALTKSLAKELAPTVRVNAVAPGNVLTDMTKGAGEELIKRFERRTPLGRSARPEEVASAVVFLASEDASFITGEVLVVDGGYSLG